MSFCMFFVCNKSLEYLDSSCFTKSSQKVVFDSSPPNHLFPDHKYPSTIFYWFSCTFHCVWLDNILQILNQPRVLSHIYSLYWSTINTNVWHHMWVPNEYTMLIPRFIRIRHKYLIKAISPHPTFMVELFYSNRHVSFMSVLVYVK